ncbi:hypothetical protein [Phosphitispora fastidiosa]|uniref:hypothetical protein n=1 Tax=Phosphitispora fastidiosa TaxID=2837202 RepID=UPI001E600423|nr:hypothetical protein [Phosphitispora fastidiosa]MBU7006313.1 hypothetical protein [Phosphitispora fastidiosa]
MSGIGMIPKPKKCRNNPANVVSDFAKVNDIPYHDVTRQAGLVKRLHNPALDRHEAYMQRCRIRQEAEVARLRQRLEWVKAEVTRRKDSMKSGGKYQPVNDLLEEARRIRQKLARLGEANG